MTTFQQKSQIMASLDALDQAQAQKVLDYIKGVVSRPAQISSYERFRREALNQIREALHENRASNSF